MFHVSMRPIRPYDVFSKTPAVPLYLVPHCKTYTLQLSDILLKTKVYCEEHAHATHTIKMHKCTLQLYYCCCSIGKYRFHV